MKFALRLLVFFLILPSLHSVPTVQLVQPANMAVNVSRPVQLDWDVTAPNINQLQYKIELSPDSSLRYIENTYFTDQTNYSAYGLYHSFKYYWRIMVFNPNSTNDTVYSEIFSFTTEENTAGTPQLILPKDHQERVASAQIQFKWSTVPGANIYQFVISSSGFGYNETVRYTSGTELTLDTPLDFSQIYYWRVRSGVRNGNDTVYTDWSKYGAFRTASQYGYPEVNYPLDSTEFTTNDLEYTFTWGSGGMQTLFAFSADSDMFYTDGVLVQTSGYYTFNKRLPAGTYYWRIMVGNIDNPNQQYPKMVYSDWSDKRRIIVKPAPINYIDPIYPIQNHYRATPLDTIISWTAVPNAINYEFEMHSESSQTGILTLTDNQYHADSLFSDEFYYWRVRAKYLLNGEETYTAWFGYWSFYTVDTITVLPVPSRFYPLDGVKYSGVPEDTYFLWSTSKRANLYQIQMAYDSTFNNVITEVFQSDTLYHDLQIFPNNTTIYWRVKALYKVGETTFKSSDWSETFSFTTSYEFTTYPQTQYPANGATNLPQEITLTWTPLPNAVEYFIRIIYPDNYYYDEYPSELSSTTNSKTFTYTKPNSTFQWYVYARAETGWCSKAQPEPWTFTTGNFDNGATPPIAPPNGANFESSNAYVEWTANPDAESYRFQLAEQSDIMPKALIAQNMLFTENSTIVLDTIMANNSINLSLNGINHTYYWRVYANLKNGDSTCWTDQWKFTVNATNYVETNQANLNIQVYANNNLLTVRQNEKYFRQAKFEIYNISGEMVKDLDLQYFNDNSIEFNINELQSGKYWLKISSDKYTKYFGFNILK